MDKFKNLAVLITVVIGALSSVYGAYSFLNRKVIDQERKYQNEISLNKKIDRLIIYDSLKSIQFLQIIDTLKIVTSKQNTLIRQQKILNASYKEHLKQAKKIDELINFYELQ
jgi:hypothetical protein